MKTDTLIEANVYAIGLGTSLNNLKYTLYFSTETPDLEKINTNNKTKFTTLIYKEIIDLVILNKIQLLYFL